LVYSQDRDFGSGADGKRSAGSFRAGDRLDCASKIRIAYDHVTSRVWHTSGPICGGVPVRAGSPLPGRLRFCSEGGGNKGQEHETTGFDEQMVHHKRGGYRFLTIRNVDPVRRRLSDEKAVVMLVASGRWDSWTCLADQAKNVTGLPGLGERAFLVIVETTG